MNPLNQLQQCAGLSDAELGVALARRAGYAPVSASRFARWREGMETVPKWVERESVAWLCELWRAERDACAPRELFQVDQKYTRMLKDFTVAEVMQLLRSP